MAEPFNNADTAVVHVHGMSGNGFENLLVDALQATNLENDRAFFAFNNRGAGVMTWLNRSDGSTSFGGSCYESFEDSAYDIEAAIIAVKRAGYSKVNLQGHSLGCTKIVHYLASRVDAQVSKVILLAPTDMRGWALRTPLMQRDAERALEMVRSGRGDELVGERCWDDGPLSARVFHGYVERGGLSDIYETKGARSISVPLLIVYGTNDVGVREIDQTIEAWKARAVAVFPQQTQFAIIEGAVHSFRSHLAELQDAVGKFLDG